jgi:hypothetical protein
MSSVGDHDPSIERDIRQLEDEIFEELILRGKDDLSDTIRDKPRKRSSRPDNG